MSIFRFLGLTSRQLDTDQDSSSLASKSHKTQSGSISCNSTRRFLSLPLRPEHLDEDRACGESFTHERFGLRRNLRNLSLSFGDQPARVTPSRVNTRGKAKNIGKCAGSPQSHQAPQTRPKTGKLAKVHSQTRPKTGKLAKDHLASSRCLPKVDPEQKLNIHCPQALPLSSTLGSPGASSDIMANCRLSADTRASSFERREAFPSAFLPASHAPGSYLTRAGLTCSHHPQGSVHEHSARRHNLEKSHDSHAADQHHFPSPGWRDFDCRTPTKSGTLASHQLSLTPVVKKDLLSPLSLQGSPSSSRNKNILQKEDWLHSLPSSRLREFDPATDALRQLSQSLYEPHIDLDLLKRPFESPVTQASSSCLSRNQSNLLPINTDLAHRRPSPRKPQLALLLPPQRSSSQNTRNERIGRISPSTALGFHPLKGQEFSSGDSTLSDPKWHSGDLKCGIDIASADHQVNNDAEMEILSPYQYDMLQIIAKHGHSICESPVFDPLSLGGEVELLSTTLLEQRYLAHDKRSIDAGASVIGAHLEAEMEVLSADQHSIVRHRKSSSKDSQSPLSIFTKGTSSDNASPSSTPPSQLLVKKPSSLSNRLAQSFGYQRPDRSVPGKSEPLDSWENKWDDLCEPQTSQVETEFEPLLRSASFNRDHKSPPRRRKAKLPARPSTADATTRVPAIVQKLSFTTKAIPSPLDPKESSQQSKFDALLEASEAPRRKVKLPARPSTADATTRVPAIVQKLSFTTKVIPSPLDPMDKTFSQQSKFDALLEASDASNGGTMKMSLSSKLDSIDRGHKSNAPTLPSFRKSRGFSLSMSNYDDDSETEEIS